MPTTPSRPSSAKHCGTCARSGKWASHPLVDAVPAVLAPLLRRPRSRNRLMEVGPVGPPNSDDELGDARDADDDDGRAEHRLGQALADPGTDLTANDRATGKQGDR